jgi:microsomal dipeptidase-like Zn-dependent dipeptidase
VGGSAHGARAGGLTALGRRWLSEMERLELVVDLAHASPQTFADVIAAATRPVLVSHTGVTGTCPGPRNLTDDQLRAVARTGGVVGIAYFKVAVCGSEPRQIARAIVHAVRVAGAEHVALGSDFDGAVATPFDTTGLPVLVDALLAEGLTEAQTRLVLGANTLRLLGELLP